MGIRHFPHFDAAMTDQSPLLTQAKRGLHDAFTCVPHPSYSESRLVLARPQRLAEHTRGQVQKPSKGFP
jgi:hypothetical protein